MIPKRINIYELTPNREKILWEEAIFVFDTSAIGELYSCVIDSKKTILKILNKLHERIWIPEHVIYEYSKNRKKVILNPIKDFYQNPSNITNCDLIKYLDEFLKKNKENYFHPFIEIKEYEEIERNKKNIEICLSNITSIVKKQYKKRKEEIEQVNENDTIYNTFKKFSIGESFSSAEILEIVEEGEIRYRNQIPPGYLDQTEKKGTQIYGDLIIWKEILNHAKEHGKSVILICNDIKDDWYLKNKKNGVPNSPRHELLREFYDITQKDFWMYTLHQFIDKLTEFFKNPDMLPLFSSLENVIYALEKQEYKQINKLYGDEYFEIKCDSCSQEFLVYRDEFNFDWELINRTERSMEHQNEYNSQELCQCPYCQNDIELNLKLWEYPIGSINHSSYNIDGGKILSSYDFSDEIVLNDAGYSPCVKCGNYNLSSDELCDNCKRERDED